MYTVYIYIYMYIGGLQIIGVLESTSGCLTFISRTPLSIITSEDGWDREHEEKDWWASRVWKRNAHRDTHKKLFPKIKKFNIFFKKMFFIYWEVCLWTVGGREGNRREKKGRWSKRGSWLREKTRGRCFYLFFFPGDFSAPLPFALIPPSLFCLAEGEEYPKSKTIFHRSFFYVGWRPRQSEFSTGIVWGTAFTEMPGEFLLQIGGEFCKKKKQKLLVVCACVGACACECVCCFSSNQNTSWVDFGREADQSTSCADSAQHYYRLDTRRPSSHQTVIWRTILWISVHTPNNKNTTNNNNQQRIK